MRARFGDLLLQALHREGVEFVVIGGIGVIARGSARLTDDLDICDSRDRASSA
jgi:hypothetical protein